MTDLIVELGFDNIREEFGSLSGVLSVGTGWGLEIPAYQKMGANKFILIEARSEFAQRLRNTFKGPNFTVIQEVAGETNPNGHLWIPQINQGAASTLKPRLKTLGLQEQEILDYPCPISTLDDILEKHQVNLEDVDTLVLETQGAETQVLKGFTCLDLFRVIFTQVWKAQAYDGCQTVKKLDSWLLQQGFVRFHTVWAGQCPWGFSIYKLGLS